MNCFVCSGNLGKDAEVRYTAIGTAVASFSLAVKAGYGERQSTLWLNCSIWGKRASPSLTEYLKKGTQVVVSGELSEREWQGNDGTTHKSLELKVNEITLVGGKAGGQNAQDQRGHTTGAKIHQSNEPQYSEGMPEDDIPFANPFKRAEYIV